MRVDIGTHNHIFGRSQLEGFICRGLNCIVLSFRYIMQSFDICVHCGMITIISLGTICPHTVITVLYGPYSLCCVLHLHWVACFITGGLYFLTTPPISPIWQPLSILCIYQYVFILFAYFVFQIPQINVIFVWLI